MVDQPSGVKADGGAGGGDGGIQHAAPSEMLPPAPPAVQEVRNHQSHRVTSRCQGPLSPSDARAWVVSFPSPALTVHPSQHTLQGPVALFSLIFPPSKTASEAALTERGPCAACLHSESVLRDQIANKPCPSTFPMLSPMQPLTQDRLRVAVCQEVKELRVTPVCHSGAHDPGKPLPSPHLIPSSSHRNQHSGSFDAVMDCL